MRKNNWQYSDIPPDCIDYKCKVRDRVTKKDLYFLNKYKNHWLKEICIIDQVNNIDPTE